MSYISPQIGSVATVAGTTASVTLFPPVAHTSGRMVYNNSSAVMYLLYGGGSASASSLTTTVGTSATFTFPVPVYGGTVTAAWASSAGSAYTTWW